MSEQYLYLISESADGPVKVGISRNPGARLIELQQGNSRKLKIIAEFICEDRAKARFVERQILEMHGAIRLVGEWLDVCERDAVIVASSFLIPDFSAGPAQRIIDRWFPKEKAVMQ